jgi:hypothetical protein
MLPYARVGIRTLVRCPTLSMAVAATRWQQAAEPQYASAYVSIRQHSSAYVSIRQHTCTRRRRWKQAEQPQHTSAYVSIRQHTSAYLRATEALAASSAAAVFVWPIAAASCSAVRPRALGVSTARPSSRAGIKKNFPPSQFLYFCTSNTCNALGVSSASPSSSSVFCVSICTTY